MPCNKKPKKRGDIDWEVRARDAFTRDIIDQRRGNDLDDVVRRVKRKYR